MNVETKSRHIGAGPARRPVRDADGPWNACGVSAYVRCVGAWSEHLGNVRGMIWNDAALAAEYEGSALGHLWRAYLGE